MMDQQRKVNQVLWILILDVAKTKANL